MVRHETKSERRASISPDQAGRLPVCTRDRLTTVYCLTRVHVFAKSSLMVIEGTSAACASPACASTNTTSTGPSADSGTSYLARVAKAVAAHRTAPALRVVAVPLASAPAPCGARGERQRAVPAVSNARRCRAMVRCPAASADCWRRSRMPTGRTRMARKPTAPLAQMAAAARACAPRARTYQFKTKPISFPV